jgi:hypothetical protein
VFKRKKVVRIIKTNTSTFEIILIYYNFNV